MPVDAQEEAGNVVHLEGPGRLSTPRNALICVITKAVQHDGVIRLPIGK